MRVAGDSGGATRQRTFHELVDPQLGGFEVHVGVHESGHYCCSTQVDGFVRLTLAPSGYDTVGNCKIGADPFLGDGGEDASPGHEEVGRLVAPGHRKGSQGCGRARHDEMLIVVR